MKAALVLVLFAVSAFAQDQTAITTAEAACGPRTSNSTPDKIRPSIPSLNRSNKALVYMVQDIGKRSAPGVLHESGIGWRVGRSQSGQSYFFFTAEPASTTSA